MIWSPVREGTKYIGKRPIQMEIIHSDAFDYGKKERCIVKMGTCWVKSSCCMFFSFSVFLVFLGFSFLYLPIYLSIRKPYSYGRGKREAICAGPARQRGQRGAFNDKKGIVKIITSSFLNFKFSTYTPIHDSMLYL